MKNDVAKPLLCCGLTFT